MIERFQKTVFQQILFIVAAMFLAFLLRLALEFTPAVRISWENLGRGILSGVLIGIGMLLGRSVFQTSKEGGPVSSTSRGAQVGRAISGACGEELVLRGYLFAYTILRYPLIAFTLNGAASYLLGVERERGRVRILYLPALRVFQGSMLAMYYWWNRSLFLVMVARFISEIVLIVGGEMMEQSKIDLTIRRQIAPAMQVLKKFVGRRSVSKHV